jgi:hypothetical protein
MDIKLYNIAYIEVFRLWVKTFRTATLKQGGVILFSYLCVIRTVIVS